jgi:hypothetical protein
MYLLDREWNPLEITEPSFSGHGAGPDIGDLVIPYFEGLMIT